jgi:SAM-dependent methyltransferase
MAAHLTETPSDWILRFSPLVPAGATVLDLACGAGRHTRLFADRGCRVLAVDREPRLEEALRTHLNVELLEADLEAGDWPLGEARFDAVVVTNYLYRPLFPRLRSALAPCGLLLYETFARGNAAFGRPGNPDFLLAPGELLDSLAVGLRVIAFEDGYVGRPRAAMIQRLAALGIAPADPVAAEKVALQPS